MASTEITGQLVCIARGAISLPFFDACAENTLGIYADISLRLVKGVAWDRRTVVKSVYAARDGVDEQRLPHNIVLESRILAEVSHPNVREPTSIPTLPAEFR